MNVADFAANGAAVIENAIDSSTVASMISAASKLPANRDQGSPYGIRNLLNLSPEIREFATSFEVFEIASALIGAKARVTRAIFFDKTPDANWKVPWHQDLTIAVGSRKHEVGFTAWTRKAGIDHVQPPVSILEKMVTLRFHLDDADETNGALKVVKGSHKLGRLSADAINSVRQANESTLCRVKSGDCLVMRPLILHSSSACLTPRHRRVIHLEFSADELPDGLDWYGS